MKKQRIIITGAVVGGLLILILCIVGMGDFGKKESGAGSTQYEVSGISESGQPEMEEQKKESVSTPDTPEIDLGEEAASSSNTDANEPARKPKNEQTMQPDKKKSNENSEKPEKSEEPAKNPTKAPEEASESPTKAPEKPSESPTKTPEESTEKTTEEPITGKSPNELPFVPVQ